MELPQALLERFSLSLAFGSQVNIRVAWYVCPHATLRLAMPHKKTLFAMIPTYQL